MRCRASERRWNRHKRQSAADSDDPNGIATKSIARERLATKERANAEIIGVCRGLVGRFRCCAAGVQAKDLKSVGVTLGPLGNPFYVSLAKGMESRGQEDRPNARSMSISHDYDLNKEVTAIETWSPRAPISSLSMPPTPRRSRRRSKRLDAAGVTVIGVDAGAKGALVNLTVDHTAAGRVACQYLADYLQHKGKVVIIDSVPMVAMPSASKAARRPSPNIPTWRSFPPISAGTARAIRA